MVRRLIPVLIAVALLSGSASFLPPPASAQYCVRCEVLDFGWSGTQPFCVWAGGSGAENCYSGEDWCYTYGLCVFRMV